MNSVMNQKQSAAPPPPLLGLENIYLSLFRRKWVILSLSLLGFIAAGVVYALWPVTYQSIAEI